MKLTIVGQTTCRPCTIMKNQVLARIDELTEIGAEFEYVDLNELENKDEFIQENKLQSTPTIWIEKHYDWGIDRFREITGYIDIDSLFEFVEEYKNHP